MNKVNKSLDVYSSSISTKPQQKYDHTVIVTRGEKGSSHLDPIDGGLRTIPVVSVQFIDTTGAGDAFNAALGYSLASGWPLELAVAFSCNAASLSVTKFGVQDGMPALKEVILT